MTYEKIKPFIGERCHVCMRCVACRETHDLHGHLQAAKLYGEVGIGGHTFSVEDIESIRLQHPRAPRRRRSRMTLFGMIAQAVQIRA